MDGINIHVTHEIFVQKINGNPILNESETRLQLRVPKQKEWNFKDQNEKASKLQGVKKWITEVEKYYSNLSFHFICQKNKIIISLGLSFSQVDHQINFDYN